MNQIEVIFFDLGDTLVGAKKKWIPGAKQTLGALSAAGFRLGVLSNTGDLTRAQLLHELPSTFDFDAFESALVILSAEVGVEKPARAIFDLAISRAGVAPGAVLFCTEDALHALAAQRSGMNALRLQAPPISDVAVVPALLADLALL